MKKVFVIISLILFLLSFSSNISTADRSNDAEHGIHYKYTPKNGSIEELYKDIIVTLIEPYISREIEKNYGQPLQYDLFDIEFLKIERPTYRSFTFTIKLQVRPFVGPHNTIGIDEITLEVSPQKTVVQKFEHIKSFPIN